MRAAPLHRSAVLAAAIAITATTSCIEAERAFDPFPVSFEKRSGAVFVGISNGDGTIHEAAVDTLSPISLIDTAVGAGSEPQRLGADVTIYSAQGIPRFTFSNSVLFDLHPCDTGGAFAPCAVGIDDDTSEIRAIVGTNLLTRQAVRFDFAASEMRFFPNTAGNDNDRTKLCDAVFDRPFAGGGTLVVANGEVEYSANRPALGACLDLSNPISETPARERGADTLLVVSTGIGPSILSQSAYQRYASTVGAQDLGELPDAILHIASGPVGAKRGEIGNISLLGEVGSDSQKRGPCRELFANRVLANDGCALGSIPLAECPCPNNLTFCRASGVMILEGPIEVAVLPDEHPLLQSLRVELRPEFPEVDGILGASALAPTRLDLDYPNLRIVGRCSGEVGCLTRPQITRRSELEDVRACLESDPVVEPAR